jgi:methyl-accepting chemotaxis protein
VYFDDEFVGVVGIDISLDAFISEMDGLRPSDNGFAFFVNKGGRLLDTSHAGHIDQARKEQEALSDAIAAMRVGEAGTIRTSINGADMFVAYAPVGGMVGGLALVAPADDIRTEANAAGITAGISDEGTRTLQIMLAALGALFIAALGGATYLNRRLLVGPLRQLATATRQVAGGDLTANVALSRGDELGALASDFNVMVEQLRESEHNLEARVEARTRELEALLETSTVLSSTLELVPLMDQILDHLKALVECAGAAVLLLNEGRLIQALLPPWRPPAPRTM